MVSTLFFALIPSLRLWLVFTWVRFRLNIRLKSFEEKHLGTLLKDN
jgi:hypothetical protein